MAEAEDLSKRLELAVTRYHTNAITSVQILDERIRMAREVVLARDRGVTEVMK